jgi:hypothetical protein
MNKRRLLTNREGPPGSMTQYLVDVLIRIKQESNDDFVRAMAHQAILKVNEGNPLEDAVYTIASKELLVESELYLMLAKQAVADAERILGDGNGSRV